MLRNGTKRLKNFKELGYFKKLNNTFDNKYVCKTYDNKHYYLNVFNKFENTTFWEKNACGSYTVALYQESPICSFEKIMFFTQ